MIAVVGLSTIIAGHILFYVAFYNFADVIHATSGGGYEEEGSVLDEKP